MRKERMGVRERLRRLERRMLRAGMRVVALVAERRIVKHFAKQNRDASGDAR